MTYYSLLVTLQHYLSLRYILPQFCISTRKQTHLRFKLGFKEAGVDNKGENNPASRQQGKRPIYSSGDDFINISSPSKNLPAHTTSSKKYTIQFRQHFFTHRTQN